MHKLMSTELGPAGGTLVDSDIVIHEPKIVMLAADHDTQYALRVWAQACGFDLTRTHGGREITEDMFDFHITLLATANDVFIPDTDHLIDPAVVMPAAFAVLGRDEDVPVLALQPDGLAEMRAYFIETYGAEPTFADFKPHISLSYAWNGEPALEELDLPDFPLVFDRIIVREFEPQQKGLAQILAELEGKADGDDYEQLRGAWLRDLDEVAAQITATEEFVDTQRRRAWPLGEDDAFLVLGQIEEMVTDMAVRSSALDLIRSLTESYDGEILAALDDIHRRINAVMLDLAQAAEEITTYLGPVGRASRRLARTLKIVYGCQQ